MKIRRVLLLLVLVGSLLPARVQAEGVSCKASEFRVRDVCVLAGPVWLPMVGR